MDKSSWRDKYCNTIETALIFMLGKEIAVDIEFTNEKRYIIFAHKLVLSLWSPLFADMLMDNNKKISKIFYTEDFETVKLALKYMYSCAPSNFIAEMDVEELIKVLKFAEKFQINQLFKKCEISMLRRKITPTNVMDFFNFAVCRGQDRILYKCTETIRDKGIVARYLKEDFAPQSIVALLKMEKIATDTEADILMLVLSWLSYQKNIEYKSEILSFVDMASINWAEYQNVLKYYPTFFSETEMVKILMGVLRRSNEEFPEWYKARTTTKIRRLCTTCKSVEKHVDILGWESLRKFSLTRDFRERSGRQFLYKFQFQFKDCGFAKLLNIRLDFGPSEIHQSDFNVLYKLHKMTSKTRNVDTTNPFFLDYHNNNYVISFWKSLKLETGDAVTLIINFEKDRKAKVLDINNVWKGEFPADTDSDIRVNLLSRPVTLLCFETERLKFVVSTFGFNSCNDHRVFLERHISKSGELKTPTKRRISRSETQESQSGSKVIKTEPLSD